MASNEFAGVEERLDDLERQLARPEVEQVVVDRDGLLRLPAAAEMYRAALSLIGGDPAGAIVRAQQALDMAVEGDDLVIGATAALSGLASWTVGDLTAAHSSYDISLHALTRAGHIADVLGCSIAMSDMELRLGHLRDAERTLEHGLDLARSNAPSGGAAMRGTADMLVGLSRLAWYRNDLSAAADYLHRADELGEGAALAQNPYRWRVGMARIRAAEGDTSAALALLAEAERVYVGDYSPDVQPIHATRARVLVARGDVAEALAWARRHAVSADDELRYLREYEHITLARILLAEHAAAGTAEALGDAVALLDRLLTAAADNGRAGTVIELEVLRAIALHAAGEPEQALDALADAVERAEADGWIRVFVDAAPAATELLDELASRRPDAAFVRDLIGARAASGPSTRDQVDRVAMAQTPGDRHGQELGLVDPLSERELDVLRLLRSDLDGPAIARELVVSLNTVRTHTQHIYTKLGVNSRRSAVSKAHQLGLLTGEGAAKITTPLTR
jgi:LuxR family transcriptional regulator, maltose regulon positive regulatory protein